MEDQKRFEEIFLPLRKTLLNGAYQLVWDQDKAQDLVQDTYYKAFKYFDTYQKTEAKPITWLFKIMKNTFLDDYRKASRIPTTVDIDTVFENITGDKTPPGYAVEMPALEFGDELSTALNLINPDMKQAIMLFYVFGFSCEEIGVITNTPLATVRGRLMKARRCLYLILEPRKKSLGY